MTRIARVEVFSQEEYLEGPEYLDITLNQTLIERVQALHHAVKSTAATTIHVRWTEGLVLGDEAEDEQVTELVNHTAYNHVVGATLVVPSHGFWFEFYGKYDSEPYWSDSLAFDVLGVTEEEGETAVDDGQPIAYADILHVLQRARADIEGLISVAGTDPHDETKMLADNYAVQWETLAMLGEFRQRLELELAQSSV
jgi:hypothetical protein